MHARCQYSSVDANSPGLALQANVVAIWCVVHRAPELSMFQNCRYPCRQTLRQQESGVHSFLKGKFDAFEVQSADGLWLAANNSIFFSCTHTHTNDCALDLISAHTTLHHQALATERSELLLVQRPRMVKKFQSCNSAKHEAVANLRRRR